MNESLANPYVPPSVEVSTPAARERDCELLPLWIWLGIAVIVSFLGTPADPISMFIALAYGLATFVIGAVVASPINILFRVVPAVLWVVSAVLLVFFSVGALCYSLTGVIFGFWACRRISRGGFRIIVCFSAGYVVGSVVGVIGAVAGAVLGAILAKRSLPRRDGG